MILDCINVKKRKKKCRKTTKKTYTYRRTNNKGIQLIKQHYYKMQRYAKRSCTVGLKHHSMWFIPSSISIIFLTWLLMQHRLNATYNDHLLLFTTPAYQKLMKIIQLKKRTNNITLSVFRINNSFSSWSFQWIFYVHKINYWTVEHAQVVNQNGIRKIIEFKILIFECNLYFNTV